MTSYFDPISWLSQQTDPAQGDLYERRTGYPSASAILDTGAPSGSVVLNENPGSGGIRIHYLAITNNSNVLVTGTAVIQDSLGSTLRQAGALGGSSAPDTFEVVGDGSSSAFVVYLPLAYNVYPFVSLITIGVTALRTKQYALEIQHSPSSPWTTLCIFLADPTLTQNYLQYALPQNVVVSAVRIRYKGDFYAASESGNVIISAKDSFSGVSAFQLAHYNDFRDAADFPGAGNDGWVPFSEGVSVFDWKLLNQKRLWSPLATGAAAAMIGLVAVNGLLVGYTATSIYTLTPGGNLTQVTGAPTGGANILCSAVFAGKIYIGLSSGYILSSSSGSSYTVINSGSPLPQVTAMTPYSGKLWIGTASNSAGQAEVLSWDGTLLSVQRTLQQPSTLHTITTSMASHGAYLFIGVAGDTGSAAGGIYSYDGSSWILTFSSSDADSVDALAFSLEAGALWAGVEGGRVYALGFDSNSKPTTWTKVYDGDASHYMSLVDDGVGNFFWLISSGELVTYVKDVTGTPIFASILQPQPTSGNPTVTAIAYINTVQGSAIVSQAYAAATDGYIYSLESSSIGTNDRTVYARFKDGAGNVTATAGVLTDDILRTTQQNSSTGTGGGTARVSDGYIYQVAQDKTVVATLTSNAPISLYAPSRVLQQTGIYESEPFYVATLSRWDKISFVSSLPAPITAPPGLGTGVQVDLYVRTANTRSDCLAQSWGLPFTRGNIHSPTYTGLVDTATTSDFNISAASGRWLQYRIIITSDQQNSDPNIHAVTLSYLAAQATYFFTSMFDTSAKVSGPIPPQFRRGLLTANYMPNGGQVMFGYTTDAQTGNTYDFSRYTPITPNTVFELPQALSKIRFGILLVSTSTITPAVVDNFAVQMDVGETDIHWMA